MNSLVILRHYQPGDAAALLTLFKESIRQVSARDYAAEQIAAWASDDIDLATWTDRFAGRFVLVAESAERAVGFAELEPNGHIDRFYVAADHQRQGIAARLLSAIVEEARRLRLDRLLVESSITARPFFESQAFVLLAPQVVTVREVDLVNFRMERMLT